MKKFIAFTTSAATVVAGQVVLLHELGPAVFRDANGDQEILALMLLVGIVGWLGVSATINAIRRWS